MNTLPKELQICIMEYNVDHRVNFKKVLREIPIKGALSRFRAMDREYRKIAPIEFVSYDRIINNYMNDKLYLANVLKFCNCCHRHSLNKPDGLKKPYPILERKCKCRCRHNIRWIARSCDV